MQLIRREKLRLNRQSILLKSLIKAKKEEKIEASIGRNLAFDYFKVFRT
jgi:hypothetical protein